MKKLHVAALLIIGLARFVSAESASFEGLEKILDHDTYERAGLSKLTSDERRTLDGAIRDYVAGKQRDAAAVAATEAVDRAVRERKVRPPEVIESKIIGSFRGNGVRTFFHLTNGEVWRPTNDYEITSSPIESPNVIIYRDTFGYKMFVEGAATIRVKRVR